jgi:uncharacterized OB-fold protein
MARVPLKDGLFSSIDPREDPRLLAARCDRCRQLHFPASATCPYCSGDRCSVVALGTSGTLYTYTVVRSAPPGYRGKAPYGFGVVEMPDGIRILSRLIADPLDALREGAAMRFVLEDLFEDDAGCTVVGWAFAPHEGS